MKTSVMEVRDMLSVLSVLGVEERIGKVPGVESVTVNFAAGSATVRYDETRLAIADIRSDVRQGGYETDSEPGPSPGKSREGHEGHGAAVTPDAAPASPPKPAPSVSADAPTPAPPKSAPADAAMASPGAAPASGGQPDKPAPVKS